MAPLPINRRLRVFNYVKKQLPSFMLMMLPWSIDHLRVLPVRKFNLSLMRGGYSVLLLLLLLQADRFTFYIAIV